MCMIHSTWLQLMLVIHMEIVKACLVLYSPFPHDCKCICTLMCYGNKVQKMCLQPKITVFFKVLWSSEILFAWNLLFLLQPSNIRIPNNTTSNRKSQRRVPWLYLLLKEKRRRAGVWFDPFKKIHTTPSESPCFLSLRRETASNAAWCAACWHEDELKNCLHFFTTIIKQIIWLIVCIRPRQNKRRGKSTIWSTDSQGISVPRIEAEPH